jgi:hypothetical protein
LGQQWMPRAILGARAVAASAPVYTVMSKLALTFLPQQTALNSTECDADKRFTRYTNDSCRVQVIDNSLSTINFLKFCLSRSSCQVSYFLVIWITIERLTRLFIFQLLELKKKEAMIFKGTDGLKLILIHLGMLFYVEGKLQRIPIHNFGE